MSGSIIVSLGGGDENAPLESVYNEQQARANAVEFIRDTGNILAIQKERPFDILVGAPSQLRGKYQDLAELASAVKTLSPNVLVVACLPANIAPIIRDDSSKFIDCMYQYQLAKGNQKPSDSAIFGNLARFLASPNSIELAKRNRVANADYLEQIEKEFPFIRAYK